MSCQNNDIVFDKIYDIVDSGERDNLVNKIQNVLESENMKNYSIKFEYYGKDKYLSVEWYDYHNKLNVSVVPL